MQYASHSTDSRQSSKNPSYHGQHPGWCPAVQKLGIDRIASIRIPKRCEMRPPVIGAVAINLKLMRHVISGTHPLQQSPVSFIPEFREIGNCVLRRSHRRALRSAHLCFHTFLESISGFQSFPAGSRSFFIWGNCHGCSKVCRIAVQFKLPPSFILPSASSFFTSAMPNPMFLPPWPPHTQDADILSSLTGVLPG